MEESFLGTDGIIHQIFMHETSTVTVHVGHKSHAKQDWIIVFKSEKTKPNG